MASTTAGDEGGQADFIILPMLTALHNQILTTTCCPSLGSKSDVESLDLSTNNESPGTERPVWQMVAEH